MRLRARWGGLPPERRKALVFATIQLIGVLVLICGAIADWPAFYVIGASNILGAGGWRLPTMDGWLPYSSWSRNGKIAYWVGWVLFFPAFLAVFWVRNWVSIVQQWQSAPALTSARIEALERELAQPTGE